MKDLRFFALLFITMSICAAWILTGHDIQLPSSEESVDSMALFSSSTRDTFFNTETEKIETLNPDTTQLVIAPDSFELE